MDKLTDEIIITVIGNINKMLKNRGHDDEQLNDSIPTVYLKEKINRFREDQPSLDIFVNSNRKAYVKFVNTKESSDKVIKDVKKYVKMYEVLSDAHGITEKDDFIFVFFNNLHEELLDIENKYPNLTMFNYKKLLINVVEHSYVPKHTKINESEKKHLKTALMIKSFNQLPLLNRSDVISKYYNFRIGDVIKIERPSIGNKTHIAYRYVV